MTYKPSFRYVGGVSCLSHVHKPEHTDPANARLGFFLFLVLQTRVSWAEMVDAARVILAA